MGQREYPNEVLHVECMYSDVAKHYIVHQSSVVHMIQYPMEIVVLYHYMNLRSMNTKVEFISIVYHTTHALCDS